MRLLLALMVLALTAAACAGSDDETGSGSDGDPGAGTEAATSSGGDNDNDNDNDEDEADGEEGAEVADGEDGTADRDLDDDTAEELFPDVLSAMATRNGDGTWDLSATLSSPYDTPQRYADAWRVVGSDGTVYGVRELLHDHATEQPFTRSLTGVAIPDDETEVTIEGRDQVSGWGGETVTIPLS